MKKYEYMIKAYTNIDQYDSVTLELIAKNETEAIKKAERLIVKDKYVIIRIIDMDIPKREECI